MAKKVIIVGGVAGGASCAARLRRLDEKCEIILFEKGDYISFANCGLPYHVGGVIEDRDELLLQTPESFNARFGVDVRINSEVTSIDREAKTVTVKNHKTGEEYTESYSALVLSPGSSPVKPPIEGIDTEGVMTLWNIPDMDNIIEHINKKNVKSAVVIGGGFIGIEMAENMRHRGMDVTLVEALNQVMAPLDFDMAQIIHKELTDNGISLVLGDAVKSFSKTDGGVRVTLASGNAFEAGLVILSIGVRPNGQLAKACGLTVNRRGGIVVDDHLRTDDDNIYAVGDAVEIEHFVTGERTMIPLAGPANKMGRMAADNICGMERTYVGSQGSSILKVFGLTAASTGLNEKDMLQAGKEINKDYKITLLHPASHAGYYPGGKSMALKVMFSPHGRILGAQAVGPEGVDKRIDVLATAIRMGATIYDLQELDLCYAPPYSSAKDPVNMAGFSAANILAGIVDNITWREIDAMENKNFILLDVRTPYECKLGAVEGSINIPVDELRERIGELDKNKKYFVYCAVGIRAYIACRILSQNGFNDVKNVAGGWKTWSVYSKDYTVKRK